MSFNNVLPAWVLLAPGVGDTARVVNTGEVGTVVSVFNGQASVSIEGNFKTFHLRDLERIDTHKIDVV